MENNIISISWPDHLWFGKGEGQLDTPEKIQKRMAIWKRRFGIGKIHWRQFRTDLDGVFSAAKGHKHPYREVIESVKFDDFDVAPQAAHDLGLQAHLYVALFDEGFPLLPQKERETTYHNDDHWQHVSWQSNFTEQHPEYLMVNRSGKTRQYGVLCLAYPEVRKYLRERFLKLLEGYQFDGLFVCLRSQSKPPEYADQFGFNEPVRMEFKRRYGRDICTEDFDLQAWRDLLGSYLTTFLKELSQDLTCRGLELSVGCARGDVLGHPLGNVTLNWRHWVEENLVDDLIINQNSYQCPCSWIQLWPMHRGYGYLQNYVDGFNMTDLHEDISQTYAPVVNASKTHLYIARQWDEPNPVEEGRLLALDSVKGLVFNSFRYDNAQTTSLDGKLDEIKTS